MSCSRRSPRGLLLLLLHAAVHCFSAFILNAEGELVEVCNVTTNEMEKQVIPSCPMSFRCDNGRVCGLRLVKDNGKSYIDVDAQKGIILSAGSALAGVRQFEHPVYVDTSNRIPIYDQQVSFGNGWGIHCFMIKEAMPGHFNIGTDYACFFRWRSPSDDWNGVIQSGERIAIYRELNSAEQLLNGTFIYKVGSGDERLIKSVVMKDDEWSIQTLSSWVALVFPVMLVVSFSTTVVAAMAGLLENGEGRPNMFAVVVISIFTSAMLHDLARYIQERGFIRGRTVPVASHYQHSKPTTIAILTISFSIGGVLVLLAIIAFILRHMKSSTHNDNSLSSEHGAFEN